MTVKFEAIFSNSDKCEIKEDKMSTLLKPQFEEKKDLQPVKNEIKLNIQPIFDESGDVDP